MQAVIVFASTQLELTTTTGGDRLHPTLCIVEEAVTAGACLWCPCLLFLPPSPPTQWPALLLRCLSTHTPPCPCVCRAADAAVDRLGTVLRLLYIRDLRQLQTTIDRMVVEVQVREVDACSGLRA